MPTGRVKWYDAEKGYGFVTSDEGGDVFVPRSALPRGVTELKSGQRVEFGVIEGRKGTQALNVTLLSTPPSISELRRRPPEELHGVIEDLIKLLELRILPDLRKGRHPDRKTAHKVAQVVHAVARELAAAEYAPRRSGLKAAVPPDALPLRGGLTWGCVTGAGYERDPAGSAAARRSRVSTARCPSSLRSAVNSFTARAMC